jgi:hypothetical protein
MNGMFDNNINKHDLNNGIIIDVIINIGSK